MSGVLIRMGILALLLMLAAIPSCTPSGPPSGTYRIQTFEFVHASPPQNVGEAIPNIWIDTNLKLSSLSGGTLTSSLPCGLQIDYTDNSFSFKDVVFTSVKITYDDGSIDPPTDAVKLPLRIAAREYESVNSVAGGRIVTSKNWIISGSIPKVVTRAAPLRLQIEGYFSKDKSNNIPFAMDQHFDLKTEETTRSAEEVLQDK